LPNVYTYLDLSHSWAMGYDSNRTAAVALAQSIATGTASGITSVDGFAVNTAGYTPVEEPYLTDPTATVGGTPMYTASFYEWNRSLDEEDFVRMLRADLVAAGFPTSAGFLIDTS